eukprot:17905-Heterococcus_DN1.PRE.2
MVYVVCYVQQYTHCWQETGDNRLTVELSYDLNDTAAAAAAAASAVATAADTAATTTAAATSTHCC